MIAGAGPPIETAGAGSRERVHGRDMGQTPRRASLRLQGDSSRTPMAITPCPSPLAQVREKPAFCFSLYDLGSNISMMRGSSSNFEAEQLTLHSPI